MKARPLLVASAGLAVIALGATEAFAAGNLMPAPRCPPGQIEDNDRCVPIRLDPAEPSDGGVRAPDAGVRPKKPERRPTKVG
jgi:hypothetical protein